MTDDEIRKVLVKVGAALQPTHVVLTSFRHSDTYLNKDALYAHPLDTSRICREMVQRIPADLPIDFIFAPAVGGVALSQWAAFHLSEITGREILAVFADQMPDKSFVYGRGYRELIAGKRGWGMEDVLSSGGSAAKVVRVTREAEAEVLGLSVICNRGKVTTADVADVPLLDGLISPDAVFTEPVNMWAPAECPLCERKVPLNVSVGKGRAFLGLL